MTPFRFCVRPVSEFRHVFRRAQGPLVPWGLVSFSVSFRRTSSLPRLSDHRRRRIPRSDGHGVTEEVLKTQDTYRGRRP